MIPKIITSFVFLLLFPSFLNFASADGKVVKIIFLHHSTGQNIWDGGVEDFFDKYNLENNTDYQISERIFPKDSPYGWENYPYDYYNIWVKNQKETFYKEEPTLKTLTRKYDMIVFKHCFPISGIEADIGTADPDSSEKRLENYKVQYEKLRTKLLEFPENKFLVWTGAAQVKNSTSQKQANRAKKFFKWVKDSWDKKGDNIFVWDFYTLETEGGLYLKNDYAVSPDDSHPNESFSKIIAPMFSQRIIDVIQGYGDISSIKGD